MYALRGAIVGNEIPAEGSRVRIDSVMAERDRLYVGVYGTLTEVDKTMGVFCVWLGFLRFLHLVLATGATVQS